MIVLGKLSFCAVSISLCLLLLRSYFSVGWPLVGKTIAITAGTWIALSASHVAVKGLVFPCICSVLAASLLCWYVAKENVVKSVAFGVLFGLMHLAGMGVALVVEGNIPGMRRESTLLLGMVVESALAVFVAIFSKKWRLTPVPMVRFLPVWLVGVLICIEVIRNRGNAGVEVLSVLAFAWMLYGGILLFSVGSKMETAVQKLLDRQQKARFFALQEEYDQQLRDKQAETRALWHDLHKYLRAAKVEGQTLQALQQLEAMLDSATQIVDVGNPVLNVMINEYSLRARATGTELRIKVHVPSDLPVTVADFYVLLGNTIENAIEACNALPKEQRIIDLTLRCHNDILFYRLVNPYSSDWIKREADPMHGHGLHNVRRCVERYGGAVDFIKENGFFTVTAHINLLH